MLFGRPVITSQGEGCSRRSAEEGDIDDPSHVSLDSSVNEGDVLLDPLRRLGGGHHKDGVDTRQCRSDRRRVPVVSGCRVALGQRWRPGRVAHHKALLNTSVRESTGNSPAQLAR